MTAQLTQKQRAFAENKAAGMTNRDAAVSAGYGVAAANQTATKLMAHPGIRSAIKAATKATPGVDTKSPTMPRKRYEDPMTFLQDVMNHAGLPIAVRADAAKQLLPYQHARLGEQGKKEKAKERAHKLAEQSGKRKRLQPMSPPQLRVVKTD